MLGDIDYSKQPLTPKLYICKPNINRIPIAYLREVYDVNYKEKLSNINELSFKILYELNLDTNSQINPNIEYIKERFIIKLVLGNIEEYFIINKVIDSMDDEDLIKEVQCYSYAYTLTDKIISQFKAESYNATEILSSVLTETNWNVDFIDPSFNDTYRTFDIQSQSVLDMVLSIGETFNGTIKFDTVNRKISLYVNENIGYDKGLTFSYGRYLAGINKEQQIDDFCTRLKCFGKDSLTINEVNPTGKNYLDDFTFFLYPFERDINRNVLKKSNYELSDELCHALLDWKDKLNDNTTVFNNLINQKYIINNLLSIKNAELSALNINLATIKSELDIAQSLSKPIYALSIEKSNKENQISSKTSEINKLTTKLNKLNQQIYNLQNSLTLEDNLSPALMVELNDFIIQKEWSDTNYFTAIDLYTNGIKKLNELRNPITQITIDIVNFLDYIEEQLNWDKIGLGDTVYVKMDIMSINVQCKITEIERNFENSEITLTITNVKDIETNEHKLYKMFKNSKTTSTTISNNKSKWDTASDIANKAYSIINSPWDANAKPIYASTNNSITIDNRGIICSDKDDPNKFIRLNNNSMIFTKDGGTTYTALINNNGTFAGNRIEGKLILGENLVIRNGNGSVVIDKDGITVSNKALRIINGLSEGQFGDHTIDWNSVITLRTNLRNPGKLPTSIKIDEDGITGYTINEDLTINTNKFARLDYRGLYIKNGAIQIDSENNTNYITGNYIDVGNAGISNTGTDDYSIRIWAGGNYIIDGSDNLPFTVTQDGTMTATKAKITGEITTNIGGFNSYLNMNGSNILGYGHNYTNNTNNVVYNLRNLYSSDDFYYGNLSLYRQGSVVKVLDLIVADNAEIRTTHATSIILRPNLISTDGSPSYDVTKQYVGIRGGLIIGTSSSYINSNPIQNGLLIEGDISSGGAIYTNGYRCPYILSGGYKIQSGTTGSINAFTEQTVLFPTSFTPVSIVITSLGILSYCSIVFIDTTSFTFICDYNGSLMFSWIAIGV